MPEANSNQWQNKIAIAIFVFFTLWWIYIQSSSTTTDTLQHQIFAASYGLMAIWGGVWGILISRKWGFFKSLFGRSILMFSLGLLAQEFGQLMYSFYIYFLKIEVPYPSLGDLGYFGSIPLYIYGAYLLGKASGLKIGLKGFENKIAAVLIPLGMVLAGYFLFVQGHKIDMSAPLRTLLDFGYPLGQAIYISFALLTYFLSRNLLGGVMRSKIFFIVIALMVQFLADYTFLFQASRETWYAGGLNDYLYLASYSLMTLGLLQLGDVLKKLRT